MTLDTDGIELLPWDTDFFGVKIGRVRDAMAVDLPRVADRARAAELDCLYLYQSPDNVVVGAAESAGFHLVEVHVELQRQLSHPPAVSAAADIEIRRGLAEDLPALQPIIDTLVPWSRFANDPRFGAEAARQMYRVWVHGSASRADDLLAVAARADQPVGLVTAAGTDAPRIGLIGASAPGGGVGTALMAAAIGWASKRAAVLTVTTQVRNVGALRFYARHGFQITNIDHVYHLWLQPPVAGAGKAG